MPAATSATRRDSFPCCSCCSRCPPSSSRSCCIVEPPAATPAAPAAATPSAAASPTTPPAASSGPLPAFLRSPLWRQIEVGFPDWSRERQAEALKLQSDGRSDAEIAAHLGEVLWSMGQREQALSIWREGAKLNADNETLTATLKRLRVKL